MINKFSELRELFLRNRIIPVRFFKELRKEPITKADGEFGEIEDDVSDKNLEDEIHRIYSEYIKNHFKKEVVTSTRVKIDFDINKLCEFFYALYKPVIVQESKSSEIYIWNKTHYIMTKNQFIENFFFKYCIKDTGAHDIPVKNIDAFVRLVKLFHMPKSLVVLREDTRFKMNFLDCVYDVRTGKYITGKNKMKMFFTNVIDYNFLGFTNTQSNLDKHARRYNILTNPKGEDMHSNYVPANLTAWNKLLHTIIPFAKHSLSYQNGDSDLPEDYYNSDVEKQHRLLEWYIGYTLSQCATVNNQFFLLLIGKGENGKSFFLQTLKRILGESNVSYSNVENFIRDKFSIQVLENKVANFSDDSNRDMFGDMLGKFKELIGGNTRIQIEQKFENARDAIIYAKFYISTNFIPYIPEADYGFLRRMLILDFKENLKLKDKKYMLKDDDDGSKNIFKYEFPFIIKKCLKVYYENSKPDMPTSVTQSVSLIKDASDSVSTYIKNNLIITHNPNHVIPVQLIHEMFLNEFKNSKMSFKKLMERFAEYVGLERGKRIDKYGLDKGVISLQTKTRNIGSCRSHDFKDCYIWTQENISLGAPYSVQSAYIFRHYDAYVSGMMFKEQYNRLVNKGMLNTIKTGDSL
jgi:hypothetical protein